KTLPTILIPRRHPKPRRARDARIDPRRRRAGVRAYACLRRRLRQPRPQGLLRDRGRRGGDRPAGGQLALEQVPRPDYRWRRASHPSFEWLEDRKPDGPGANPGERAAPVARRLWL